jgi:hypothetical protein
MPVFDIEPTDSELAKFLDPEGRSVSVRVEDTAERLIAQPRGFPLWFVMICLAIPLGGYAGIMVYEVVQRKLDPLHLVGVPLACGAVGFFFALFRWMNRGQVSKGDFFVLDKDLKILTLPRRGLQIRDDQIRCFVEVHANYVVWRDREEAREWLSELSVLVNTDHGEIARYPVITCMRIRLVTRIAITLADFFGVERRLLKVNEKTRKRLAAADFFGPSSKRPEE